MKIEFKGKTNKDYLMVNTAIFHLKDGNTITIDRKKTEYSIENGMLSMLWTDIYVCKFNEKYVYLPEIPASFLSGSWVELELEDDADEDYTISDIEWCVYDEYCQSQGTDKPVTQKTIKGNYLLITTDGYSLDDYAFYNSLREAQISMQEAYERCAPDDWFDSYKEMSHCGEWDAILYNNGNDVFVWNIIKLTE